MSGITALSQTSRLLPQSSLSRPPDVLRNDINMGIRPSAVTEKDTANSSSEKLAWIGTLNDVLGPVALALSSLALWVTTRKN